MNTRRVLHIPVTELLILALILITVSGLGLLASFASWLTYMNSIQQPIQVDALNLVSGFHDAVNSDNLNGMLELFAKDATINDDELTFNGRNEIQDWVLHSPHMAGLHLTMISSQVAGERVFWRDMARSEPEAQSQSYIFLQWIAVIQKGKIKTLTVSRVPMPDGK